MNPVAVWFEIATTDLDRAETFYRAVLGHPMRRENSPDGSLEMSVFDPPDTEFKGALVKGEHFTPGMAGTLVYFNGGRDLAEPLSRVETAGGRVVMPKTAIGPYGHIAMFIDSEGNRVGIHSME
ncbi:MAG TPA: VOC family protein [Candidatus Omnitrophota bacterium]|nr:VOC family protein [Candidatus Omnitrophota bacterium]